MVQKTESIQETRRLLMELRYYYYEYMAADALCADSAMPMNCVQRRNKAMTQLQKHAVVMAGICSITYDAISDELEKLERLENKVNDQNSI